MKTPRTILLTGYGPFDDFPTNPSGVIARRLNGWSPARGVRVRGVVLPVDTARLPATLARLIRRHQPVLALGLGLAFGDAAIRLEIYGHNWVEIGRPDQGGNTRAGTPLAVVAPAAYRTSLPAARLATGLLGRGIPAYVSNHAGTHLCNQWLFTMLHLGAAGPGQAAAPPSIFVHLPAPPELAARRATAGAAKGARAAPAASMALELQIEAIGFVLQELAGKSRAAG